MAPFLLPWENPLNALRVLATLIIFGYSCLTDWKTRRAPNELWYVMGGIGLALAAYELWQYDFSVVYLARLVIGAVFIYALVYVIFRVGGFGGADAKALIATALMFPLYPVLNVQGTFLPLAYNVMSPIFALTVLGNAVVLTIVVPLGVLAYNLLTVPPGEVLSNPLGAVTGYKAGIGRIKGRHLRLMHRYEVEDGKLVRRMAFRGSEPDDKLLGQMEKWMDEGLLEARVWVTPKLPFLIPITIGFVTAVIYGDILMQVVALFAGVR